MVIAGIAAAAAGSPGHLAGRQAEASACPSIRTKGVEVAQILGRQLDEVVKRVSAPASSGATAARMRLVEDLLPWQQPQMSLSC